MAYLVEDTPLYTTIINILINMFHHSNNNIIERSFLGHFHAWWEVLAAALISHLTSGTMAGLIRIMNAYCPHLRVFVEGREPKGSIKLQTPPQLSVYPPHLLTQFTKGPA